MNKVNHPVPIQLYGWMGLLSIAVFILSLIIIHSAGSGIDWFNDYVSNMANEPFGWIFSIGAFIHGFGYLSIALGLRYTLCAGWLRGWGVNLLILVTIGVFLVALFPTDPPNQIKTTTGLIHRVAASIAFMSELAALFIFSTAFIHDCNWQRFQKTSLFISIISALAISVFILAIQLNIAPGLAERIAMIPLVVWEVLVCIRLIKYKEQTNPVTKS